MQLNLTVVKRFILLFIAVIFAACIIWQFEGRLSSKKNKGYSPTSEKPFVVIIPSYNNASYVEKNLFSVYTQCYQNFRVIYIDDHSSDATFDKAEKEMIRWEAQRRTTLIRNTKNLGALANIYNAVHSCSDHEIIVLLDGDDFLAHENVLSALNDTYANHEVWMTYGSFLDYPSYLQGNVRAKTISARAIETNSWRKQDWVTTHLRTFYASLFKAVNLEDLFFRGHFFPMGWDLAMMLPMLEMSGPKARFIPEVLYLYNRNNPLSDHKVNFKFQQQCAHEVRSKHPYQPLARLPSSSIRQKQKADLLIFSYHRPMQLFALLESIEKNLQGINQTTVLYRADTLKFKNGYTLVKHRFPNVHFVEQKEPPQDFYDLTLQIIFSSSPPSSEYILFAVDDMVVKQPVDLRECIEAMEKTKAYGFYLCHSEQLDTCFMLNRHQGIPPYAPLTALATETPIFAWQFAAGADDWSYPNSLDMVLYKKENVKKDFNKISFTSPTHLESKWNLRAKKKRIGLFYAQAKSFNIPTNLVTKDLEKGDTNRYLNTYSLEELLEKLERGLKIDLNPLFQLESRSRHVATDFLFIPQ